jgi:creatinine amidohydrolase
MKGKDSVQPTSILTLTGGDAATTLTSANLAIIPFGSIEYHGPHAPLGTDSLIAGELAGRLAKRLDGILCPLVAYTACPVSTQRRPGTLHINPDVMTAYIEAILRSLFDQDVKGALALNAHDGNISPIQRAAECLAADYPDRFILLINWWQTLPASEIEKRGLFSQKGGHGHGGPLETSAAWAVAADSVDLTKAEDLETDFEGPGMMSVFNAGKDDQPWPGYSGRIHESTIDKGEILLYMAENRITAQLQTWLKGGKVQRS